MNRTLKQGEKKRKAEEGEEQGEGKGGCHSLAHTKMEKLNAFISCLFMSPNHG